MQEEVQRRRLSRNPMAYATGHDPTVRQEAKLTFLEALKQGYSVGYSAEQAGVDRSTAYTWQAADPEFAAAWASCYERGSDWAEDKLRDRVEGGNTDATLAMLRIRRRLVPDGPPPVTQILVLWGPAPALPAPHIIDVGGHSPSLLDAPGPGVGDTD